MYGMSAAQLKEKSRNAKALYDLRCSMLFALGTGKAVSMAAYDHEDAVHTLSSTIP